jgi:hypothetical protein
MNNQTKVNITPCILFDSRTLEYNQPLRHYQTSFSMLDSSDEPVDPSAASQSHPNK